MDRKNFTEFNSACGTEPILPACPRGSHDGCGHADSPKDALATKRAITYANAHLLRPDDPKYRRFVSQIMQHKPRKTPGLGPSDRDRFSRETEGVLCAWLNERFRLSGQRILGYDHLASGRRTRRYRELDAVFYDFRNSILRVFEVKTACRKKALSAAVDQVNTVRSILASAYPRVTSTILFVDCGQAEFPAFASPRIIRDTPVHLLQAPDERPADGIGLMVFSVDDIVRLAGEKVLHLSWRTE